MAQKFNAGDAVVITGKDEIVTLDKAATYAATVNGERYLTSELKLIMSKAEQDYIREGLTLWLEDNQSLVSWQQGYLAARNYYVTVENDEEVATVIATIVDEVAALS